MTRAIVDALPAAAVIATTFALMLLLERIAPLRRTVESKVRRMARNVTLAGLALVVAEILRLPLLVPMIAWTSRERFGLLYLFDIPQALRVILGVVLLDYTLWWWHWLSHRVPFLWRFHLVHHVDRDMDASTALRFHFGEHALSTLYRTAQVMLLGTPPAALFVWQLVLFVAILFHHSNVRLPVRLEAVLVRLIVTPRMHGIHHSARRDEANSNWANLLSAWDFLHGTILLGVPQGEIDIGVPAYRDVRLRKLLILPFIKERDDWRGAIEARAPRGSPLSP